MREIKFRGRRIDNGEWVYGSFVRYEIFNRCRTYIVPYTQDSISSSGKYVNLMMHEVDPETVGQWVGVEDKNKVKIFEGDVVEHVPRNEAKYVVKYLTSGFYLCPNNKDFGEYFASLFAGYDDNRTCNYLEVIDNIYDNSELLTQ